MISGTPTATGTVEIVITASDGALISASHTVTVTVVTAPVITNITANVAQATNGDALVFTATISEAVTVTGTPTLTLDVGGTAMTATYTGGTGTAALTFMATTPATGDDATVTVTAINLNGGTIIGNTTTQPLVTSTTGQVVSSFVVDNSNPVFTSGTAVNAAENQTAAYTSATTDDTAVSYTLGGTDASLFNIANGAVTFATAPNFEVPTDNGTNGVYDITVTATDALGHATNQNVAITVTNVNEAPALTSGATSTATLAVNQAFSEDVSGLFADPDAGTTLTYAATGLPSGVSINTSTGVISGTPTATGTVDIVITASDGALISASHTVTVTVVTAPSITSTLDGVTNLDPRSKLVLSVTEDVTWAQGTHTITITNEANGGGKDGFRTETTANTQTITVTADANGAVTSITGGAVTIDNVNNKIVIDPTLDLDISNNYSLSVSTGAFLGVDTGQATVAFTPASFSTVTPGLLSGGEAAAAQSQIMNTSTGAVESSLRWLDVTNPADDDPSTGTYQTFDAGTIDLAFLVKDMDSLTTDITVTDTYIQFNNFGANDLIYIDNQLNQADAQQFVLQNVFSGGVGTSVDPFSVTMSGTSLASSFNVVVETTLTLPTFADALIAQINSNNWSNTGIMIAG